MQHFACFGPKQSSSLECVQRPRDGPAVFIFSGKASSFPTPLHSVPTRVVDMSERLYKVHAEIIICSRELKYTMRNEFKVTLYSSLCGCVSYFSQLSDSGQKLGEDVRHSYHQLVLMLVEALQGFGSLNEK